MTSSLDAYPREKSNGNKIFGIHWSWMKLQTFTQNIRESITKKNSDISVKIFCPLPASHESKNIFLITGFYHLFDSLIYRASNGTKILSVQCKKRLNYDCESLTLLLYPSEFVF